MRVNLPAFNQKNTQSTKSPRFVIRIDFSDDGTDPHFFTSHSDIPTVSPVTHGVLQNTSSISQKLIPERANSSIGSLSFSLVDASKAITAVFNAKRVTRKVLFGKKVTLYLGFEGMAWNDYRVEQTQFIDKKLKFKNGVYFMSCRDSQDRLNKSIMQPLETRLAQAINETDAAISVYDINGWQLVERDADFSDAPSTTCTYLEISDNNQKEYCRVTAIGASFTVVRGVLGTVAQAWTLPADASDEKGPKIKEVIFLQMKSLKLAYAVMTGIQLGQAGTLPEHWHAGMDVSLLTQADFQNQDDFISYGLYLKKTDAKKFIESEVMLPNSRYLRVNGGGGLDIKRLFAINEESSPVFTLDETNIIKFSDLAFDASSTYNKFEIDWSYDPIQKKAQYRRKSTFEFADSVTDYGEKVKSFKFRLINGINATTTTLINTINSFSDRFAGEGAKLKISTFSKNNDLETGDVCIVRHSGIMDFNTGASIDRAMQIISTKIDQRKGTVDLELFGSTFTPEPLTDGSIRVLSDSFYNAIGSIIPNITSNALVSNTTLIGSGDHNISVFYFLGDLTINSGVTLKISDNVQLRVMGQITLLGDIDCAGNGRASGAGFIGTSIGKPGKLQELNDGDLSEDSEVPGSVNEGLYEAFPTITLDNPDGLSILGIPKDLRGSAGATGGDSQYTDEFGAVSNSAGGTGNESGSAVVIICRGMSLSGAGAINVSGVQGNAATPSGNATGGYGGHSTPGGFLVLLDGGTSSLPAINGRITALSNNPSSNTGFDIKQSAARVQFIPQPRTPIEDDPIDDDSTTYTWVKYADDINGVGLSDSSTGKDYIGFAFNKSTEIESTNPADYSWSLYVGQDGNPGADGIDGTDAYTNLIDPRQWVIGTVGSQSNFVRNGTTDENSIILDGGPHGASEAIWRSQSNSGDGLGPDGGWYNSIDASEGYDLTKSYRFLVWIKNSESTGASYLGCTNCLNLGGSINTNPYFWSGDLPTVNKWYLVVGILHGSGYSSVASGISGVYDPDTGEKVLSGVDFKSDGVTATQIHRTYLYYSSTLTNVSKFARPRVDELNGNEPSLADVIGRLGVDGNTVAQITIYRRSASAPAIPTGGSYSFDTNLISAPTNWNSTIQAGADPIYASVAIANIVGTSGTDSSIIWGSPNIIVQNGTDGQDGNNGSNGLSIFQATIYRRSASVPATPSANSGSYNFGTNVLTPPTNWLISPPAGSNPMYSSQATFEIQGTTGIDSTQSWSTSTLFVQDGSDGIAGTPGADGQTTYTWLKYGDNASGGGLSDSSTGKVYMGLAVNKTTATESTNPADYVWSKILGDDGADGADGIPGAIGADGQTTYTWVRYADSADGTVGFSNLPAGKIYIGFAFNKTTATESTNPADYQWSLYVGSDGTDGSNGTNGQSTYNYPIYIRSSSTPATPSGGSYNFGTNTGTPPTGWSNTISTDESLALYSSYALASITGDTGTDSTLSWTSPNKIIDANPFPTVYAFAKANSNPGTPTGNYIPVGWFATEADANAGGFGSKLWMSQNNVNGNSNSVIGAWSTTIELNLA